MTDIFDDLVATKSAPEGEAEATEATAEGIETNPSEWPKTLTLPVGEAPEGAVPIAEFAKLVNEQIVRDRIAELLAQDVPVADAAIQAMGAQVNQASFYQAVKGQRNALPHYVVKYEVDVLDDNNQPTGEVKTEEKVFIPVEVGQEWWKNRPTRGGGGAARSEEDVEKRLYKAGKKFANLEAARERRTKLEENIKSMESQLDRYIEMLKADGKTLEDAKAAYDKALEAEEAEKAIGDND